MKKYLIFGLIIFVMVGCTSSIIEIKNKIIKTRDINNTKKILTIDLDTKFKKDNYLKGGIKKRVIPIFIGGYRGDNDEVAFIGKILKKSDKIKVGDNDEVNLNSAIKYIIKTSELKDRDIISLIDKKGKIIFKMVVRIY